MTDGGASDPARTLASAPLTRRELRALERAQALATDHGADPVTVEPIVVEPVTVEPATVEPVTVEPAPAASAAVEPVVVVAPVSEPPSVVPAIVSDPAAPAAASAPRLGAPHPVRAIRTAPIPQAHRPSTTPTATRRRRRAARTAFSGLTMLFVGAIALATTVPANALHTGDAVTPEAYVASAPRGAGHEQILAGGVGVDPAAVAHDSYTSVVIPPVQLTSLGTTVKLVDDSAAGSVRWPLPAGTRVASGFGPRVAPTEGASTFHEGVDFDPGNGAQITAIADGTVRLVDPADDGGLGVHVIVDHVIDGELVSSVYGHMQIGSVQVTEGERITAGQAIGKVGSTGVSTGPHLHFEIRLDGTDAVDPFAWLQQHVK